MHEAGFMVDMDFSPGDTFNKKIRKAQLEQYNYILGEGEGEGGRGRGRVGEGEWLVN